MSRFSKAFSTHIAILAIAFTWYGCNELDVSESSLSQTEKSNDYEVENDSVLMDSYNDPAALEPDFERTFQALPLSGKTRKTPWTDSYWPKNKGGISYRWQTGEAHTYQSPDRDRAQQMTAEEIARLSPSEKYDLYVGSYEYPLTTKVKSENRASESAWQGLCHGWTPAAIHFQEPAPVTGVNPDGIEVRFGSSDIKALLTYFQGEVVRTQYAGRHLTFGAETRTFGSECRSNNPQFAQCYDANPGAFHITLANYVGLRKQAFGIDATSTYEKWNQPVYQYDSRVTGRETIHSSPWGAVERVFVESDVTYTMEIEPTWDAVNDTSAFSAKTKTYMYSLELDKEGTIIGGEWLTKTGNGGYMSLYQVIEHFKKLDENGDGTPDLDENGVNSSVWQYFDFPDYVWFQDRAKLPTRFEMASKYAVQFQTESAKKATYAYMGKLTELYKAGIEAGCRADANRCDPLVE